jgi:N6-adenosine-specific RNA methylase IME4
VTELAVTNGNALAIVEQAAQALAQVETVEQADDLWRKIRAVEEAARIAGVYEEAAVNLRRLQLRAKRRYGELLGEARRGGQVGNRNAAKNDVSPEHVVSQNERNLRKKARKLAEVPEDLFEEVISAPSVEKITEAAILKAVRAASNTPSDSFDAPALPDGQFRTIVADPPWRYGNTRTRGAAEDHYPTMTIDELCALDVRSRAADQAHLYLWVTNNFLLEGFQVMDAWGFDYKTCLTWVKPQMGMGNYFRGSTEHILFGVRGGLATLRKNQMNWFQAPRGRHSAKPESFYEVVETCSPGPYFEMFARRARLGDWHYWGNESLETAEVAA